MRKLSVLAIILFLVSAAGAVDAVIDPGNPEDFVLKSGSNWDDSKTFDGSKSSGSGTLSYSWNLEEESKSDSGTEASFSFDRNSPQVNTIKLTVSNGSHSDTEEVTQILRDEPEVREDAGSGLEDIDIKDGSKTKTYETGDFNISNTFDDPVSYSWEVDGSSSDDGTYSGEDVDVIYSETGNVDVKLTVTDSEGYSGSDKIDIDVENSSSSSSTTDTQATQTGGGAAPGLASEFDETDFLISVEAGDVKKAEFDESPVTELQISIAQDVSDRVAIQSRATGERPDAADSDPSGNVHRYIELEKVNITNSDIENVNFSFQVEKSWFEDNQISEDSVRLMRYNDGWEELSTDRTGEDSDYAYYTAESPGFSVFAISGEEKSADFQVENLEVNATEISPGDTVKIDLSVKNTGSAPGNYTASFELAGESFEEEFLNVSAGETRHTSFVKKIDQEGSWNVEVGSSSTTVSSGSGAETADAPAKEETGGNGLMLIVAGFIGFILLISGGVLLYVERGEEIEPYLDSAAERIGPHAEAAVDKVEELREEFLEKMKDGDEEQSGYSFEGFDDDDEGSGYSF